MNTLRLAVATLIMVVCSAANAAYPYDSVCEIICETDTALSKGSGTIIAVSDTQALVLTCEHVLEDDATSITLLWTQTQQSALGRVVKRGGDLDIALIVCDLPKGLLPVPVTLPTKDSGPLTNVGYPGGVESLEWQRGDFKSLSPNTLRYTQRPIPGMSGGATLDRYGNLVGVIQFFTPTGGGSTSGTEMMAFIDNYRRGRSYFKVVRPKTTELQRPSIDMAPPLRAYLIDELVQNLNTWGLDTTYTSWDK